jgi:hypothetical protein
MAERGTIQKIADKCGVDHKTVRNALNAAGLTAGRGGYDFNAAVDAVEAIADPARVAGHAVTRGGGNGTALGEARARFESLKAHRLEIENAKAEGALISRNAVTTTGAHIIATARTALLSLGYRLAEKVAGKTDIKEITRLIDSEVRDVLGALADETKFFAALEADALT